MDRLPVQGSGHYQNHRGPRQVLPTLAQNRQKPSRKAPGRADDKLSKVTTAPSLTSNTGWAEFRKGFAGSCEFLGKQDHRTRAAGGERPAGGYPGYSTSSPKHEALDGNVNDWARLRARSPSARVLGMDRRAL